MSPQLWIFAGPNGAGKSAFVDRYILGRVPVVNPDTIARTLPGSHSHPALNAGRAAIAERQRLLSERQSFAIETTLTGRTEIELMRNASGSGYKVNLIYIGLGEVGYSIGRVRSRVASGGHDVPLADLLRRFPRSRGNLPLAIGLADRVLLFDNSRMRRQLIMSMEQGRVKFRASNPPPWTVEFLCS